MLLVKNKKTTDEDQEEEVRMAAAAERISAGAVAVSSQPEAFLDSIVLFV